jgi:hypothetical protein
MAYVSISAGDRRGGREREPSYRWRGWRECRGSASVWPRGRRPRRPWRRVAEAGEGRQCGLLGAPGEGDREVGCYQRAEVAPRRHPKSHPHHAQLGADGLHLHPAVHRRWGNELDRLAGRALRLHRLRDRGCPRQQRLAGGTGDPLPRARVPLTGAQRDGLGRWKLEPGLAERHGARSARAYPRRQRPALSLPAAGNSPLGFLLHRTTTAWQGSTSDPGLGVAFPTPPARPIDSLRCSAIPSTRDTSLVGLPVQPSGLEGFFTGHRRGGARPPDGTHPSPTAREPQRC